MNTVMVSRVLVGVNFDEASAAALKMAGVLAAAWDAAVTLFHSAPQEAPEYFTTAQIEGLEAEREQSRSRTAHQLRAFAEPHMTAAAGVVVDEGPPQDAMLRMATSFDLLVLGTHQRHGARRWWLGSVAESVVRRSPRPVLVVPLIVLSLPSGTNAHEQFGTIVQVLKECVHPVLFVPPGGGLCERRAS